MVTPSPSPSSASAAHPERFTRHTIFQSSLMTALLDGIYDGELTIGELLGKGNFGIGTFNALDGEMVILDGTCYQLRSDGTARRADLDQRTPYAVATNFVPRIRQEAPDNITRANLSTFIDGMLTSENYMYAVKITGHFRMVRTRTVSRQEPPYRPMTEAVGDDELHELHDLDGTLVGFRTPIYEKHLSVPGCHVHFIDANMARGGHVLDFTLASGTVEVCPGTDLDLRLPLTQEFSRANLNPDDLDEQLSTTEDKS